MKESRIIKAYFLILFLCMSGASLLFAQETSERDYVDEQNMTVSEVEELIQSQSAIYKIDLSLVLLR